MLLVTQSFYIVSVLLSHLFQYLVRATCDTVILHRVCATVPFVPIPCTCYLWHSHFTSYLCYCPICSNTLYMLLVTQSFYIVPVLLSHLFQYLVRATCDTVIIHRVCATVTFVLIPCLFFPFYSTVLFHLYQYLVPLPGTLWLRLRPLSFVIISIKLKLLVLLMRLRLQQGYKYSSAWGLRICNTDTINSNALYTCLCNLPNCCCVQCFLLFTDNNELNKSLDFVETSEEPKRCLRQSWSHRIMTDLNRPYPYLLIILFVVLPGPIYTVPKAVGNYSTRLNG
jgi:hypothetical protein